MFSEQHSVSQMTVLDTTYNHRGDGAVSLGDCQFLDLYINFQFPSSPTLSLEVQLSNLQKLLLFLASGCLYPCYLQIVLEVQSQ